MIQTENEIFTAMDTVNAGLITAIQDGKTKLECHIEIDNGKNPNKNFSLRIIALKYYCP